MKLVLFAGAVAFALTATVHAEELPSFCNGANIRSISVPLYPGRQDSEMFVYRYQISASDKSQPIVIHLPGGPGQTSISENPKSPFAPLPTSLANVVYTDQRGTGCNPILGEKNPREIYKSHYFAEDVVALINDLHSQGFHRYVIYGHSFGTLHATKVAKLVQEYRHRGEKISLPESIVLEGIIGKVAGPGESLRAYQTEWNKVKARLSSEDQKLIAGESPLGIAPEKWGYFIMQNLYLGRMPKATGISDLSSYLEGLSLPVQNPKNVALRNAVNATEFPGFGDSFHSIACQEFTTDFFQQPLLDRGEFSSRANLCENMRTYDPYDSSNYQIESPIIYFEGTNDAATPMSQALYHFKNQRRSKRSFVTIQEAGHNPLQLSLYGCKGKLWSAILESKAISSTDLKNCPWAWSIEVESK